MRRHHLLKTLTNPSTREGFMTMTEASKEAKKGHGVLFFERGFYGIVWFEGDIRKIRDLKGWLPKELSSEAQFVKRPGGFHLMDSVRR